MCSNLITEDEHAVEGKQPVHAASIVAETAALTASWVRGPMIGCSVFWFVALRFAAAVAGRCSDALGNYLICLRAPQ